MKSIIKITHQLNKRYSHLCQEVMQKYKITHCELDILLFLYNNPECDTAKDIVEKRGIVKSHASMGIDKLIQKGYLKTIRDQQDKRKYHLHLLTESQPIIEDGLKIQERFYHQIFQNISDDEKQVLWHILEQIYQNAKEE